MNLWLAIGAFAGLTGVAAGAFGAHGLRHRLTPDMLAIFETAARYQMYHALALVALGLAADRLPAGAIRNAGALFTAGIVVFSGSLYALSISGVRALGAITPIGGVAFLAGWLTLLLAAFGRR